LFGLKKLPPEKRRRYVTIYVAVTLLALVVVAFFVYLLVMLAWMERKVDLPEVARVVHPKSHSYWAMDIPHEQQTAWGTITRDLADDILSDLPSPIQKLAHKGMDDAECPVRIVASGAPTKGQPPIARALSLGRYPGRFHIVRRDLKRRMDSGTFAASVELYKDTSIFVMNDTKTLPAIALVHCTLLRGRDAQTLKPIIDALKADAPPPLTVPEAMMPSAKKPEKLDVSPDGGN
jgi:hypothetical protein